MLCGEALGGGETCSGFDHGAHDGMQGVGIASQEGRECEEALGEPGTVVEESRGFPVRGEIDLDGRATERLEASQRGMEEPLGLAVPEELQLPRDTESKARRRCNGREPDDRGVGPGSSGS